MSEVYSNDMLKIIEEKNKSTFRIELLYPNAILINSLIKTRIITSGTITDDYRILKFKALSVKTLKQFQEEQNKQRGTTKLTISETASLIANLAAQLKYLLTKENRTVLGYAPENIIVINGQKFAFLGSDLFTEIVDNRVLISYPYTTNDFFVSPELLKIKEIPTYIHYKTAYFSLACLAIYVLLSDNEFYIDYINNHNSTIILDYLKLHPIKNTKVYWLLSRCLVEEVETRSILFI
jgi:hypothetical protein